MTSENSRPLAKLTMPNLWMKITLGPIAVAMLSWRDLSNPRMSAVIATIEVMPITTPSTVRPERSLFVRTVSKAMTMTSRSSPYADSAVFVFILAPQRLNRIQARRADRRIQPEEQTDQRRDA